MRGARLAARAHMNRRLLLLPVLLLAAFLGWRHFQPPLGDREVILGELEAMRKAAQNQNPNGILSRLDKGFTLKGASKSELRLQLTSFFFQSSDVRLDLGGVDAKVEGEGATSGGSYTLRWKSNQGGAEEARGNWSARWRKAEGAWKIVEVSGIEGLGAQ